MPREIFIDCGTNVGAVLERFIIQYPDFEFFGFEPNIDLIPVISARLNKYQFSGALFNKAVWVYDGTIDFYLGHHETSTILLGKVVHSSYNQQIDYANPRQVECIDFSQWVLCNFDKKDHIIVKMDIEGAEYAVLAKMIADHSIEFIDELIIEWHWDRFPDMPQTQHDALLSQLTPLVKLSPWD